MSLQCSKVSVLLFQRDRQWLVQLAHAVLSSKQTVHVMHDQGDGVNVYEGYKHNGIAQVAISSCESVVVANVGSHVGYDSRLDALAGIQGRNCLAVPIIAGEAKASARCVGVLFATNKLHDGFTGDALFVLRESSELTRTFRIRRCSRFRIRRCSRRHARRCGAELTIRPKKALTCGQVFLIRCRR